MKKILALLLIIVLLFTLAACAPSQTDKGEKGETTVLINKPPIDSFTDTASVVVTDELKALFQKLNQTLTGAELTPVAYLAKGVTAGTYHLVLCKETSSAPDAAAFYALVTVYEDEKGNAEIVEISSSTVSAPISDPDMPLSGGWGENSTAEMTGDAQKAFDKATETLTGAQYTPRALLSMQVVAGMNYMILCKAESSVTELDGAPYYTVIEIFANLDDGAEITNTYDFVSEHDTNGEEGESSSSQSDE